MFFSLAKELKSGDVAVRSLKTYADYATSCCLGSSANRFWATIAAGWETQQHLVRFLGSLSDKALRVTRKALSGEYHRARSSPSPAVPWLGFYPRIIVLEIS